MYSIMDDKGFTNWNKCFSFIGWEFLAMLKSYFIANHKAKGNIFPTYFPTQQQKKLITILNHHHPKKILNARKNEIIQKKQVTHHREFYILNPVAAWKRASRGRHRFLVAGFTFG